MKTGQIRLFRGERDWLAWFVGDEKVRELFGTDVLPTSYGVSMPAGEVLREVQARNPGTEVILLEARVCP